MILICISLMTNGVEYLSMCYFTIGIYFPVKYLISLAHFQINFFVLFLSLFWSVLLLRFDIYIV